MRPWMIIVAVGAFVIALALGVESIRFLTLDGMARFTGETRVAAQIALHRARLGCGEEIVDRLLMQEFQVVDVQLKPGYCPVIGGPAFRAKVRTYALILIPTETIFVDCGEVNCTGQPTMGP